MDHRVGTLAVLADFVGMRVWAVRIMRIRLNGPLELLCLASQSGRQGIVGVPV